MTNHIEAYIQEHEESYLEDLKGWLRIPSISTLPEHAGDIERAAEYAIEQLRNAGFESTELIKTLGHPLVYGEWLNAPGKPTLLMYGHYDVQPVDPIELWESPPFEPTIRDNSIYARGASDDKGQVMVCIKALESLMRVEGRLPINIKVLLEGEEEDGGEAIEEYVKTHSERLSCDAAFVCDTDMPGEDQPALIYGLRGIVYTELEVRGAKQDLHSGSYGGVAPNPLHALAIIIGRLKGTDGHINIPGLYEHIRQATDEEKKFWQNDPLDIQKNLLTEMGVKKLSGEQEYPALERIWARPTLEIHGISGGFVGEGAKTVIPAIAKAKISLRLPSDITSNEAFELLEQAVKEYAPEDVSVKLHKINGGESVLVEPGSDLMLAAASALQEVYGKEPAYIREGGSIPVTTLFHEKLGAPVVLMGFALPDDRAHAPNEKYSVTQFFKGIRTVARFIQKLGE